MVQHMKAALCRKIGEISIEEVPIPIPIGRELLVRVKFASLCHSDISIVQGAFGDGIFPQIIGHEALGVVAALGPEAESWGFNIGDLVGAPLYHSMCLECNDCKLSGPQFCTKTMVKGLTCPGYFSQYTCVDPTSAVVVLREQDIADKSELLTHTRNLSPLFCAGVTIWDALERAHLGMADTVAVVGAGGLGQIAVQYANALGAKVIALDVRDEQLVACKGSGGAHETLNTNNLPSEELQKAVMDLNDGRFVDVAIVTSGVVGAYTNALSIVRSCGKVIIVGLPHEPIPLIASQIAGRSISLIGSHVPGQSATRKCLDFTRRKQITPLVNKRSFRLEDLNEMIQLMKAGKVEEGRMVINFF